MEIIETLMLILVVGLWVKAAIIRSNKLTAAAYHKKYYGSDED